MIHVSVRLFQLGHLRQIRMLDTHMGVRVIKARSLWNSYGENVKKDTRELVRKEGPTYLPFHPPPPTLMCISFKPRGRVKAKPYAKLHKWFLEAGIRLVLDALRREQLGRERGR